MLNTDSLLFAPQQGGPGSGFPPDKKGKARALPSENGKDFLALDLDGDRGESGISQGGGGYQQMQLVEQQASSLFRIYWRADGRTITSNPGVPLSNPSNRPLQNWDRSFRSSLIWSRNRGRQCSV